MATRSTGESTEANAGTERKQANVRLPLDVHRVLSFLAESFGMSLPELMEQVLTDYVVAEAETAKRAVEQRAKEANEAVEWYENLVKKWKVRADSEPVMPTAGAVKTDGRDEELETANAEIVA